MSLLDAALHVGTEVTYGTPVALTRSFEAKTDEWKSDRSFLESVGMRAGMHTVRSDRRKIVNMGGTGKFSVDVLDKGMGMILQCLLGTAVAPAQQATSTAYLQTYSSSDEASAVSLTMQQIRPYVATTGSQPFTHHGCMVTGWKLSQAVNGLLVLEADFDFEDVDTSTAAGTATYPASSTPFDWTQAVATIDDTATDVLSFEVSTDEAMRTDRRYLRGSALKKKPVRGGVPQFSGSLALDFDDTDRYDEFVAGGVHELVVTWTGSNIEDTYDHKLTVTMAAVQWIGESPQASISETSTQPLPFRVLHNGTDPAIKIEYQSTDTTV